MLGGQDLEEARDRSILTGLSSLGLLLGAGVVALYALGVRAISPATTAGLADGSDDETLAPVSASAKAFAVLCFAIRAAALAYGLSTLL